MATIINLPQHISPKDSYEDFYQKRRWSRRAPKPGWREKKPKNKP